MRLTRGEGPAKGGCDYKGYNVGNPYGNGHGRPRKKGKGTLTYEDKAQELKSRGWWEDEETGEWCFGEKGKPEHRCKDIDSAYRQEFGTDPDE